MKQKLTSPHLCSQFNWSAELSETFSPENINTVARTTGFVERIRNLLPDSFIQLCGFCEWKESFPSLKRQCQWLWEKFKIKISEQGLHERFTQSAVDLLQCILGEVSKIRTEEKLTQLSQNCFSAIYVFDSTIQELFSKCENMFKGSGGGASSSAIKIQYGFDLLSGNLLHLTSRNGNDSDSSFKVGTLIEGALLLFDLGYFSTAFLGEIQQCMAFFLCRYRFGTILYIEKKGDLHRLDILKVVRKMKEGQLMELSVLIGEKDRVPVRLILEKLPEELANRKRRKLKTDKQSKRKKISNERLEFCIVNAFVTNIPAEVLPTEKARQVYSIRWQIEIVFKTWKSVFKLKDVTNVNPYRLSCMYYGVLIRILIATRIFWVFKLLAWHEIEKELSEIKSMKILAERIESLFDFLTDRKVKPPDYWEELKGILFKFGIKESRKKKPLPYQILKLFSLT